MKQLGLRAMRTGGGHYRIVTAAGKFLATIGSTPSSSRTVRNTEAEVRRRLRAQSQPAPAQPAAVSAATATAAAGKPAQPASRLSKRDLRRAQKAAEERREAEVAERIANKHLRKARPEPEKKVPKEWVTPQNSKTDKFGAARLRTPTGELATFSPDVTRMNGRQVKRQDIHPVSSLVFWREAKATGRTPSCMSCYQPAAATGVLYYGPVRWLDRRDIYLAFGRPLKYAEAKATLDHKEGTLVKINGEYVGTGSMTLCGECHDKFRNSGISGITYDWLTITNWPAFLADCVYEREDGGLAFRKPPDITQLQATLRRQSLPDFSKIQVLVRPAPNGPADPAAALNAPASPAPVGLEPLPPAPAPLGQEALPPAPAPLGQEALPPAPAPLGQAPVPPARSGMRWRRRRGESASAPPQQ